MLILAHTRVVARRCTRCRSAATSEACTDSHSEVFLARRRCLCPATLLPVPQRISHPQPPRPPPPRLRSPSLPFIVAARLRSRLSENHRSATLAQEN
uniref:Uncharacterized protein n=1 Tax=Mycena chlorophos TaxID=658473 RepID=A0ABQ0L0K1_MYCCL|nr:predicted protein [Mycena chlorophos]